MAARNRVIVEVEFGSKRITAGAPHAPDVGWWVSQVGAGAMH
jgi:hypothetical protein